MHGCAVQGGWTLLHVSGHHSTPTANMFHTLPALQCCCLLSILLRLLLLLLSAVSLLQFLCCELAALQQGGKLPPLQVADVALITWRLGVAKDLQKRLEAHLQVMIMTTAAAAAAGDMYVAPHKQLHVNACVCVLFVLRVVQGATRGGCFHACF